MSRVGKLIDTESRIEITKDGKREEWGVTA